EGQVVREIMLGDRNPLASWQDTFDGAEVSATPSCYPPFDDVLEQGRRMRASTISLLDTLTEDDLDRASAQGREGVEELFGTFRGCLQYVADHWFMHRGQLADARRAAGLDRMWF